MDNSFYIQMANETHCLNALRAGEYEAQHYIEWLHNEDADCSEFLLTEDDDMHVECDHNYFQFLLDCLTKKAYYDHKMLPWVADWWRHYLLPPEGNGRYGYGYHAFWATIWRNPNTEFLFHNRLHLFKVMHSSGRSIESNFEAKYHLGPCVPLLVNMIENEDSRKTVDWHSVIKNSHPDAMKLAEEYFRDQPNSFRYAHMCSCAHHMPLIKKHMHYLLDNDNDDRSLAWYMLCDNTKAGPLLEAHRSQWNCEPGDDDFEHAIGREDCYYHLVKHAELVYLIADDDIRQGLQRQEVWVSELCRYAHGLPYIEPYVDRLWETCWNRLCGNPAAVGLVEEHIDTLSTRSWECLCGNPNAVEMVKDRNWTPEEWSELVGNPEAVDLIEAHLMRLTEEDDIVTFNENKGALKVIEKNPGLIREELLLHPDVFYVV